MFKLRNNFNFIQVIFSKLCCWREQQVTPTGLKSSFIRINATLLGIFLTWRRNSEMSNETPPWSNFSWKAAESKWQQWHCSAGLSKELEVDSFYSLSSSTSHSKQLRSWVMCCTAELKYFACFPWNMLKDAVDRTWHSKRLLSLPKMCCIISFFQHKELKRERKEKGKELHIVTCHPGWKIILFLFHFETFTLDIQSSLCGGKKAAGQTLTCSPTAPCLEEMCRGAAKLEHLKNVCGTAGHPCAWQQCWDEGAGFPNRSHIHLVAWFPDSLCSRTLIVGLSRLQRSQVATPGKSRAALQGLILTA